MTKIVYTWPFAYAEIGDPSLRQNLAERVYQSIPGVPEPFGSGEEAGIRRTYSQRPVHKESALLHAVGKVLSQRHESRFPKFTLSDPDNPAGKIDILLT
jgi:hypothetical protein